jgi:arsenite methyltransferase
VTDTATPTADAGLELNELQQHVRDRYAEAAVAASAASTKQEAGSKSAALSDCCGPSVSAGEAAIDGSKLDAAHASGCCSDGCCSDVSGTYGLELYDAASREGIPDAALLASLGCGNPVAVAELREGETVLDLGSGGGIDVILSAKRVGPTGRAYGVDMTDEMLALAQRNAEESGIDNAIFLKGVIEAVPLPAESVDVVISNCVVNLSVDKPAVLAELARVLRPGGRIGISDVVAEDRLGRAERADRGSYVGCIAGALSQSEYVSGLEAVGFEEVSVTFTHEVADGMHGAIVKATKPAATSGPRELPLVGASKAGCC